MVDKLKSAKSKLKKKKPVKKIINFLKAKHWLALQIIIYVLILSAVATFLFVKTAQPIQLTFQKADMPIDRSLTIRLNQYLRDINTDQIKISPDVKGGKWTFNSGGLFGHGELVFTHDEDFKVDTTYTVNFGEISRLLLGEATIPDVKFTTQTAPDLAESGLAGLQNDSVIAVDYTFAVSLKFANRGLRDIQIRTAPEVELTQEISGDQNYTWKPKELLPQGQTIAVEIVDAKNQESLLSLNLKIADEPSVKNLVKEAGFTSSDTAIIEFNQPIVASAAEIVFDLAGRGEWISDTAYQFKPEKVEPGKTYGYHIKAGLRSLEGGILTHDIDGRFSTTGARAVVASSPRGKELGQGSQQIKFTFDGAVDRASAEQRFSVDAGEVAGFSWLGNTLIATVNNLGFQRTVTATMAAGVVNNGFGLPSNRAYAVSFTTEIRSVKLGVPAYRQNFAQSCEESSLRMALAYRGIGSSDEALLHAVGYSGQESRRDANGGIVWEDPNVEFVGNVHGSQAGLTGYGVFAGPIARVARSHGRSAEVQYGVNAAWVAQQIYNNNPVVLWGSYGASASRIAWLTPAGKVINVPMPTHTRTVVGVKGEPSNPLGFWINDPASGRQVYWSTAQMIGDAQRGANQAVAIY